MLALVAFVEVKVLVYIFMCRILFCACQVDSVGNQRKAGAWNGGVGERGRERRASLGASGKCGFELRFVLVVHAIYGGKFHSSWIWDSLRKC
jgi:hypothetical protein